MYRKNGLRVVGSREGEHPAIEINGKCLEDVALSNQVKMAEYRGWLEEDRNTGEEVAGLCERGLEWSMTQ